MKKITALEDRLLKMSEDDHDTLPTRREVLRLIGNAKAESADDARRTLRIVNKLRDKSNPDLVLENDDVVFIQKLFEKNPMSLTAWCQGQVLDLIESADKVTEEKKV